MRSQHPHTKRGRTPRLLAAGLAVGTAVAAGVTALSAGPVTAAAAGPAVTPNAQTLAVQSADALVAARPAFLHADANDQFVRQQVISSNGAQYVPYLRTYSGLPVVGGDFVVATNSAGQVVFQSVAQDHAIGTLSTTPTLTSAQAVSVATGQLKSVSKVEGTQLVVYALGSAPAALAWESTIDGVGQDGVSRLSVDVDARTGAVLHTQEHVEHGSGTSAWNGPNPVHIDTSGSGSSFSMNTPNITNMPCQDAANNTTFTKSTDTWGSSDKTSRETGCVDALFGAQSEFKMLAQWDGRNGMDGNGGAWPIRVGDQEENAYYDGSQVQIGYNSQGQWIGAIDVIAHEMGHGVDDHTPGGISGNGTQEFVADTFGAATEWFTNEPSPYDVPDFTVGEQINLDGSGPIRNMYNPSLISGDPNCYSSSIPGDEVHAAAGPGNHWFYLVAEGTNPTNGQPTSPTCNSSTVTGVGIQNAEKIMYNAMLLKTSGASYLKYRVWTLQAAKTLDPTCAEFNTVKAAWTAVSVPAQSGEPTCTASTSDFSMAVSPTSGSVNPGSSLTATVSTTLTSGSAQSVALTAAGLPSGATASFSPSSVTTGSTSTLTLSTASTTPPGSYPITITGTGSSATHTATFTLTVNGSGSETVSVSNPGNQTSTAGAAISTLQISATDSAGKALTYSATGLPAGLSISGSGAITGTPTTAGSSSVTVTASSGTASGSTTFSWTVNPAGGGCSATQLLGNAGFETGSAAPWTASAGVIDSSTSEPAHGGTWKAWLNGYGTTHTDTLAQKVSIPATCTSANFSFFVHIDTAETTGSTAYDKLSVQVLNSAGTVVGTLATYSNLNAASGYVSHSFNLASYIGQTVSLKFTGTEDSSLQTSFVVDDTALNVD